MSSSDKTPELRGAVSSSPDVLRRRSVWRLLVVLVLLLAVLSGAYAAITLRLRWHPTARQLPLVATLNRDFQGEAFGDQATVEELRVEAQRSVEQLLERYPQLVQPLYVQAQLQLRFGQTVEASEAWFRCLELDPKNSEAYISLAAIELESGRQTDAIRLLRQAMACPTPDPRVPRLLADALLKRGEIDEATALLERQIKNRQATSAAVALLGQCYLQQKKYERAVTMFQTAVAATPQSRTAHYGLARAYQRLKEQDLAQEHMSRFHDLSRADSAGLVKAVRTVNDVESMRKIVAETLVDVGRVYLEQGDFQAAEESLLKASIFDEQDQDCWELLVFLYEQTQEAAKGLLVSQKLCEINPDNSAYWLNVGMLKGRLLRRKEALAAVEKALSLSPNDPECRRVYEILRNGS